MIVLSKNTAAILRRTFIDGAMLTSRNGTQGQQVVFPQHFFVYDMLPGKFCSFIHKQNAPLRGKKKRWREVVVWSLFIHVLGRV